jgi:photosystem II stability/assembly factor-like uncharacterized protein
VKRIFRPTALTIFVLLGVLGCASPSPAGSVDSASTLNLVSQSFVDPDNGWAVAAACPRDASSSASFACRTVVYATVDGGRTWSTTARIIMSPKKIRFVDHLTGWLIGSIGEKCGPNVCPNVVMLSQDGGKSWDRVSTVSGELVDAAAFSRNDAWVLGQVCADAAGCSAEFVRTTTAGQTWDNRDLPLVGGGFHLERFGTNSGWIGGTINGGLGTALLGTLDGGSTWNPLPLPCQGGWSRFDFTSASAGWLVCSPDAASGSAGAIGQVYQTSDAGRTWSRLGPVADPSGSTGSDPKVDQDPIGGLRFVSPDLGWLALADGRLFESDDGGRSWRKILTIAAGVRELQFVNSSTGWILGQSQVWSTTDSGKTWTTAVVIPNPSS